jgi:anhydro-N-acetylmuramic acid kinase
MGRYYLGLISGTSVDGVDAALCEFGERDCTVAAAQTFAYPPAIAERIQTLIESRQAVLAEIGALDVAIGRFFADCAVALIKGASVGPGQVRAIGHHGQTIWHEPDPPEPFSWQLGDPNSIAAITGIDTVADLRRLDMALGGQGAPLVPAFHEWLFADPGSTRVVLNIGGIANLTVLAPGRDVLGFDTGPGNTLLDLQTRRSLGRPYDDRGLWAASGKPDQTLLEACTAEPYFGRAAPKSTGRELFNASWLHHKLGQISHKIADVDVAATLLELSATTIAAALAGLRLDEIELITCGGGTWNEALMTRIGTLTGTKPKTTADFGLDPDHVEAAAMAWLARARIKGLPGNLPSVTAAREAAVLGALYCGVTSRT